MCRCSICCPIGLLDITLRSRLVEKLAMALYDCLFQSSEVRNRFVMVRTVVWIGRMDEGVM